MTLPQVAVPQGVACTPSDFSASCVGATLSRHDPTALWAFGCKTANVTSPASSLVADTTGSGGAEAAGAGDCATALADHDAAIASAVGCAAACLRQRDCPCFLGGTGCASNATSACEAFQYTAEAGGSPARCELLADADASALTAGAADHYRRVGDAVAGPGQCGCDTDSSGFENKCIGVCQEVDGSPTGCVRLSDRSVFRITGSGECRGETRSDKADSYYSMHEVGTQAECLSLCNSTSCFGVTVTLLEDPPDSGVLSTTQFRCVSPSKSDQPSLRSVLRNRPLMRVRRAVPQEVWDQGVRVGAQESVIEPGGGVRPAQCWLPLHVLQLRGKATPGCSVEVRPPPSVM